MKQASWTDTPPLGPLPEFADNFRPRWPGDPGGFCETQMRLYALQEREAERERCVPDVDELAQHIRWLNGSNKMSAGRLAEQLVEWLRSRA